MSFIKGKPVVSQRVFKKMLPELKARAFAVAGVESADVLQRLRERLADLPAGGQWDDIKKDLVTDLSPFLVTSDDPEKAAGQARGAVARAELLLRIHGFQSYSAAAHRELDEQRDVFTHWKYLSMEDRKVRHTHAALNGTILPHDSPFWRYHYPPWEWGCRCQVVGMMEDEVAEIAEAEKNLPPESRNVFTGARLKALEEQGKLHRGPSQTLDVRSAVEKGDDHGFSWEPGSLKLSVDDIKGRYDAQTWSEWQTWARGERIEELDQTVWEWMQPVKLAEAVADIVPDAFPETLAGLKVVRKLGGSTGAELVEDAAGNRFVRKKGNSEAHLREEATADDLYRALGANVPDSRLYETDAGPVKLAKFIEGDTLDKFLARAKPTEREALIKELQQHFGADALLGNWDVVGMGMDNVLVDTAGKPWRIDNGGSLRFRAQGAMKTADEWNEFAGELWTLRNAATNPQTARVFGGLNMFDIARQVEQLDLSAATVPADLQAVLDARLGHMKDLARKALDMEHDQWTPEYTGELTRHMLGLRKAGIVARLPKELKQAVGDVMVQDENGKAWDDLRAERRAVTAGKPLGNPGVLKQDKFFPLIENAAKSLNHHISNGSFAFSQAKVDIALKLKPALENIVATKKTGSQKAMAQKYLIALQHIELSATAAAAKKALPVPTVTQYVKKLKKGAALPAAYTPPVQGSLVEALDSYIQSQGGNYRAVVRWKGAQAGDSWNDDAAAYKAFLAKQLRVPEAKVFWRYGKASADAHLAGMEAGLHGSVDAAFTAHHAFVQELLAHTEMRHNDRGRRLMRVIRTENKRSVMAPAGLKPGQKGVELAERGLCESSSPFMRTGVYGTENTVQAVPHSRITGVYLMEREPGQGGSSFLGDYENEFTFVTPGIPFDYEKSNPSVDAGNDAVAWGLKLNARP